MITPLWLNVPCRCGRKHRLPAHPSGKIVWCCGSTRTVYTLHLNPAQFQRLMQRTMPDHRLFEEGVCTVHHAAAPKDDQQRCEDCGWLLISYRAFLRRCPGAQVVYWPTGSHVGLTTGFDTYLADLPTSPHRERICFMPAGVH